LSTKRLEKHANAGMGRPFPVPVICSCRLRYSEKKPFSVISANYITINYAKKSHTDFS
jgi:hypothetical protein